LLYLILDRPESRKPILIEQAGVIVLDDESILGKNYHFVLDATDEPVHLFRKEA